MHSPVALLSNENLRKAVVSPLSAMLFSLLKTSSDLQPGHPTVIVVFLPITADAASAASASWLLIPLAPAKDTPLLLPESVDDYVGADNPVRFIDAFVDQLDLAAAGFIRVAPKATGRPGYAPGASSSATAR
jgi:hypothetical protein